MRNRLVGVVVVTVLCIPGAAQAATVVGQSPPQGGTSSTCQASAEFVQLEVGNGPSYEIPSPGGVVTEVQTFGDVSDVGTQLAIRIYTRQDALQFTPVFDSGIQTVAAGLNRFPVRFSVGGGERLGVRSPPGPALVYCSHGVLLGDTSAFKQPPADLGVPTTYGATNTRRVDAAAVVEPDSDGDGYGDETQDGCRFQATAGAPCDLAVAIDKGPKKKARSSKATFRFSSVAGGLAFECRLDKKRYRACESPLTLRRLKDRKHRFRVRGVDPSGIGGPSDQHRWRVVD